jgi:hypothetical protein
MYRRLIENEETFSVVVHFWKAVAMGHVLSMSGRNVGGDA